MPPTRRNPAKGVRVLRTIHIIDATSCSDGIAFALRNAGFVVLRVRDRVAAGRLLLRRPPDHVIVVDAAPLDGVELLAWLQERTSAPVTVIVDQGDEERILEAFAGGADDAVDYDCHPGVYVARVRSFLRRLGCEMEEAERCIGIGDVWIEWESRMVQVRGRQVHLTPLEYELLATLMRDPGVVYTREDLLDSIWGSRDVAVERTIDAHVWKLRRKIEPAPDRPQHILSVPHVGYRFRRPGHDDVADRALAG
jgi:two-component system response regulator MtrA